MLQALDIRFCYNIGDTPAMLQMTSLKELRISWCSEISDAAILHRCPDLRLLEARNCNLTDAICKFLSNCKALDLAYTQIGDVGLHSLSQVQISPSSVPQPCD